MVGISIQDIPQKYRSNAQRSPWAEGFGNSGSENGETFSKDIVDLT
jgi:hypothetical protein